MVGRSLSLSFSRYTCKLFLDMSTVLGNQSQGPHVRIFFDVIFGVFFLFIFLWVDMSISESSLTIDFDILTIIL